MAQSKNTLKQSEPLPSIYIFFPELANHSHEWSCTACASQSRSSERTDAPAIELQLVSMVIHHACMEIQGNINHWLQKLKVLFCWLKIYSILTIINSWLCSSIVIILDHRTSVDSIIFIYLIITLKNIYLSHLSFIQSTGFDLILYLHWAWTKKLDGGMVLCHLPLYIYSQHYLYLWSYLLLYPWTVGILSFPPELSGHLGSSHEILNVNSGSLRLYCSIVLVIVCAAVLTPLSLSLQVCLFNLHFNGQELLQIIKVASRFFLIFFLIEVN